MTSVARDIRVEEGMHRVPLIDEVVERLEINEHIGCTEGQEAHMLRCYRMRQRTRAEVEGCDWHRDQMRSNVGGKEPTGGGPA